MLVLFAAIAFLPFTLNAWMNQWEPAFKSNSVKFRELPLAAVRSFALDVYEKSEVYRASFSSHGAIDLNGDGVDDYVILVPWLGCGLNASGCDMYFVVSDGKNGRIENFLTGYGAEMSDIVEVAGKIYFRHSYFFNSFEKSKHNHWVYQMFAFDTNGVMRCANSAVGRPFPAVTIFYEKPRFKQIELTEADLKAIAERTKPVSVKFSRAVDFTKSQDDAVSAKYSRAIDLTISPDDPDQECDAAQEGDARGGKRPAQDE